MNDRHIKMELEIYAKRSHDALIALGYTDDEIDRAADGLLSGTRIWPTFDGEHVAIAWLWIESLSSAREGVDNLLQGRIDAARADLAKSRENCGDATNARYCYENASRGGRAPKRRQWAERAAERVSQWSELPGPADRPFEFEDLLVSVYRDGDTLCAADIDDLDAEPKTLARSTFERRYLKK